MKFFKKYWYLLILAVITVGLGVITFLTTQFLNREQPVAPTVPQAVPQAVENKCIKQFTLSINTPTPTPTGTLTPTPTATPTPTGTPAPTQTPTPTPTGTPGPTATPTSPPPPGAPTPTPTPTTPKIPVSGSGPSVLGASTIAGGILLLLAGLFAF